MPVGDNDFTRLTWRAGKKGRMRKRVNGYAGKKTAPPAFLEAAKFTRFKPGRPGHKICHANKIDGTPCGKLALKGMSVCGTHGGFSVLARQGKFQPTGRTTAFKAERAKVIEDRTPIPPADLINLPVYQQANQWDRMRMIRAWGTATWPTLVSQL